MGYSQKYLEHFEDPKNVGEIAEPDALSEVAHQGGGCFDRVRMTLRVEDGIVINAMFKARACSGTIATTSAATEWVKGKTVEQASQLTGEMVAGELDGVPPKKQHSADLSAEAIREAVKTLL